MNATLRSATPADASRVASLLIDTRSKFMPYAPSAHPEEEVRAWVAGHLLPSGGVVVAEIGGHAVAVMATESADKGSWVTQMAVDPSLVGQGLGSLMLAHALRTLEPPICLHTFQANIGARRFYERHGFVATTFTDGQANEELCPDVQYEYRGPRVEA